MSQAIPKYVRTGKNSTGIYALIKNGNVYKLKAHVDTASIPAVIAKIKAAKVINIKHWIKVKEGAAISQAARIRELQAQVTNLKAQLLDPPSDAEIEEMEIRAGIYSNEAQQVAS